MLFTSVPLLQLAAHSPDRGSSSQEAALTWRAKTSALERGYDGGVAGENRGVNTGHRGEREGGSLRAGVSSSLPPFASFVTGASPRQMLLTYVPPLQNTYPGSPSQDAAPTWGRRAGERKGESLRRIAQLLSGWGESLGARGVSFVTVLPPRLTRAPRGLMDPDALSRILMYPDAL